MGGKDNKFASRFNIFAYRKLATPISIVMKVSFGNIIDMLAAYLGRCCVFAVTAFFL